MGSRPPIRTTSLRGRPGHLAWRGAFGLNFWRSVSGLVRAATDRTVATGLLPEERHVDAAPPEWGTQAGAVAVQDGDVRIAPPLRAWPRPPALASDVPRRRPRAVGKFLHFGDETLV